MNERDDLLERLVKSQESIAERLSALDRGDSATSPAIIALTAAFSQLADAQKSIAENQNKTLKQIHRPQNAYPPDISVFNLRGDKDFPRPPLKCPMFIPFALEPQVLTREEIELLNLLEEGLYEIKRTDGSKITLPVKVEKTLGTDHPCKLTIIHDSAFRDENKDLMPSLVDWMRAMCNSRRDLKIKAAAVLTMDEECDLIAAGKLNDESVPADGIVVSVGA